jgi:hypothetical protein
VQAPGSDIGDEDGTRRAVPDRAAGQECAGERRRDVVKVEHDRSVSDPARRLNAATSIDPIGRSAVTEIDSARPRTTKDTIRYQLTMWSSSMVSVAPTVTSRHRFCPYP